MNGIAAAMIALALAQSPQETDAGWVGKLRSKIDEAADALLGPKPTPAPAATPAATPAEPPAATPAEPPTATPAEPPTATAPLTPAATPYATAPTTYPTPAASAPPTAPVPLGRSGAFGLGIALEPLAVGAAQGVSGGGATGGLELVGALLIDLGPRWALRTQLDVASAGGSTGRGWAMIGFTPGLVYRWRDSADQDWVPYFGAALKLGAAGADRPLLGLPSTTASPLVSAVSPLQAGTVSRADWDWHHNSSSSSDPDFTSTAAVFPELWAGGTWRLRSWLALDLGLAYTWARAGGRNLHVFHERVGLRIEL